MNNTQSSFTTKTVDGENIKAGRIEIQCLWPKAFEPVKGLGLSGYLMQADFCHRSSNPDPVNCCTDEGLRDVQVEGFIKVVGLAPTVKEGDTIDVYGLGWQ
jgi:hypothetical protein